MLRIMSVVRSCISGCLDVFLLFVFFILKMNFFGFDFVFLFIVLLLFDFD